MFFCILIGFLAISAVSAGEDNVTDDSVELCDVSEVAAVDYQILEDTNTNNTTSNDVKIEADNLVKYYKSSYKYKFRLLDGDANPISNVTVKVTLNKVIYNKTTNKKGVASVDVNLNPGTYKIKVEYNGTSATNTIKVFKSRISMTKNYSTVYGTQIKYNLKVVDNLGKAMVSTQVTFKVGKKVYKVKTNKNGVATLKLNYPSGSYKIKYSVDGLSGSNTYKVKNYVNLKILKWGNTGDISKVYLLKKSMPNNKWVKKAVAATKQGLPLLTFKGGSGKTVFITAGVHGNELSSQVAAMRMIKYLSTHPIKGTVYMIPFVNPKAISHKVRYTDKDYNRVAAKSGTISNKIVKLIVAKKCDAYGDFHTTKPGGAPGQNIVMGSKTPATKCIKMTKYIASHSKVNKRLYAYAGKEYPGALADNVNKKGIPAVICEVMLPHNTLTSKTIKTSYSMMTNLLKFNNVI